MKLRDPASQNPGGEGRKALEATSGLRSQPHLHANTQKADKLGIRTRSPNKTLAAELKNVEHLRDNDVRLDDPVRKAGVAWAHQLQGSIWLNAQGLRAS